MYASLIARRTRCLWMTRENITRLDQVLWYISYVELFQLIYISPLHSLLSFAVQTNGESTPVRYQPSFPRNDEARHEQPRSGPADLPSQRYQAQNDRHFNQFAYDQAYNYPYLHQPLNYPPSLLSTGPPLSTLHPSAGMLGGYPMPLRGKNEDFILLYPRESTRIACLPLEKCSLVFMFARFVFMFIVFVSRFTTVLIIFAIIPKPVISPTFTFYCLVAYVEPLGGYQPSWAHDNAALGKGTAGLGASFGDKARLDDRNAPVSSRLNQSTSSSDKGLSNSGRSGFGALPLAEDGRGKDRSKQESYREELRRQVRSILLIFLFMFPALGHPCCIGRITTSCLNKLV